MGEIQLYRPGNGTEGDAFMGRFCDRCAAFPHGVGCRIVGLTIVLEVTDLLYPRQWRYGKDGSPTCAAFKAADA